jgi:hypothetical protein
VAETQKVLGQSAPLATTLTDAYTAAAKTVVSSVVICNRGAAQILVRISVAVAGAADATKQYLYYDLPVPANDTFIATIGITMGIADVVRVYTDLATASFNLFGIEVT